MIGFASRPLLNRHNGKWHPPVVAGASLADAITTLQKKQKGKQNNPDQLPPTDQRVENAATTVRENKSGTELAEDRQQDPESPITTGLKNRLTSNPEPYLMARPAQAGTSHPFPAAYKLTSIVRAPDINLLDFFPWSGNEKHPENQFSEPVIRHGFFDKQQMIQHEIGSARQSVKPALKESSQLQESLLSVFASIRAQRDAPGDVSISNSVSCKLFDPRLLESNSG
jgi:hypothetical protein